MKLRVIATLVAVLAFGVGSASAQSIGIFSDLASSSCNVNAAQYIQTTFYINAIDTDILAPPGITGAEFRVDHNISPADAIISATPNAGANVVIGGPLTGGVNIAWPACQGGPSVNLFEVSILVLNPAGALNQLVSVRQHTAPSNAAFPCALITMCDPPFYTALCVNEGEGYVNGNCTVAVEEKTWTEVKGLFN